MISSFVPQIWEDMCAEFVNTIIEVYSLTCVCFVNPDVINL